MRKRMAEFYKDPRLLKALGTFTDTRRSSFLGVWVFKKMPIMKAIQIAKEFGFSLTFPDDLDGRFDNIDPGYLKTLVDQKCLVSGSIGPGGYMSVDTLLFKKEIDALRFGIKTHPDEFGVQKDGWYRLWWD
jgi:hypothetical protein